MTENPPGVGIGASNRQSAEPRRLRVEQDRRGAVGLGPVHRLHVERRAGRELLRARRGSARRSPRGHGGFQADALGGAVGASGVTVHVGHDALEHARAVEDRGAEPGGMRARADEAGGLPSCHAPSNQVQVCECQATRSSLDRFRSVLLPQRTPPPAPRQWRACHRSMKDADRWRGYS